MSKAVNEERTVKSSQMTEMLWAMGEKNRLRIIMALSSGQKCVCILLELLKLAPSTVSKHLSILKRAGLVRSKKVGTWVYYSLNNEDKAIKKILTDIRNILRNDKQTIKDNQMLEKIEKTDKEKLCRRQRKN